MDDAANQHEKDDPMNAIARVDLWLCQNVHLLLLAVALLLVAALLLFFMPPDR